MKNSHLSCLKKGKLNQKRFSILILLLLFPFYSVFAQAINIGAVSVSPMTSICPGDMLTVTIDITNNTGSNINGFTNYIIQYRWDGAGTWSNGLNIGQSSGNFPNGTTKQFTFTITAPAAGSHVLNLRARDTNGPTTLDNATVNSVNVNGTSCGGGGTGGGTGTQPSDNCEDAPTINTTGTYSGNTGDYTADSPNWLNNSTLFGGGTVESSAYYKFVANSTSVSFTMCCNPGCTGNTGGYGILGVQAAIFHGDCYDLSGSSQSFYVDELVSNEGGWAADTDPTNAGSSNNNNLGSVQSYSNGCLTTTLTGLVIGDTYYIVVDGFEGDDCPYSIQFDNGIVLSMNLISFTGEAIEQGNQLEWATSSERNSDYFILEATLDGKIFEQITTIKGAGTSDSKNEYTFLDRSPLGLITYYRLTQVDFNGNSTKSDLISIKRDANGLVVFYPNPVINTLNVVFDAPNKDMYTFSVVDVLGKATNIQLDLSKGQHQFQLAQFENLSKGLYFIRIYNSTGEILHTDKVEKQ